MEAVPIYPCARADPGVSALLSQHGAVHYRMFLAMAFRVLTLATSATFMEYSGAEKDAPMATFGFLSGKPVISGDLLVIHRSQTHQGISPSFSIGQRWCHPNQRGDSNRNNNNPEECRPMDKYNPFLTYFSEAHPTGFPNPTCLC